MQKRIICGALVLVIAFFLLVQYGIMSPFGPMVNISGEVVFEDYEKGPIVVVARSKRITGFLYTAYIELSKPGKYTFQVPANPGKIYVGARNFDLRTASPREVSDAPGGEYEGNLLKVGSKDIGGIDIVIRKIPLLPPLSGPAVTISGEVIFKDYERGSITVIAQKKRSSKSPDIALVEIPGPGKYSLKVPANAGDIYVRGGNIDPKTTSPKEADDMPRAEYEANPLKVASKDIDGIDITLHSPLRPPTGPAVTISGEVIFEDYKRNPIVVVVQSKIGPGPPDIASVELPKPGKYSLKVPANAGDIYVMAGNIDPKTASPREIANAPGGGYEGNPLKVGSKDIKGIDIVLATLKGINPGQGKNEKNRRD